MLEVYDRVVNSRSYATLLMLIVAGGGCVCGDGTAGMGPRRRSCTPPDWRWTANWAIASSRRCSRRTCGACPGARPRSMNDFRMLRDFLHSPVVLAVMEAPVSLVFMVLIFAISPVLGWVADGRRPGADIRRLAQRKGHPAAAWSRPIAAPFGAQQYADGALRNAQVIEAMGMQRDIHRRWIDKQREFLDLQALASDRGRRLSGGHQVPADHHGLVAPRAWPPGCCCTTT